MRALVHIGFSWRGYYPLKQKSPEELAQDKQQIKRILERMGYGYMFHPEQPSYDLTLEQGDPSLRVLIEELNKRSDFASPHVRVEKQYNLQELASAELLLLRIPNHVIKEDYYWSYPEKHKNIIPVFRRCPTCRAPLEQVRPLMVKKPLMKKKHISLTYQFQVVMAEWVGDLFHEQGLTGFELWPVQHYTQSYEGEPILYQLKPTNVLPPMAAPPTEFESIRYCEDCKHTSQFLKHTHWWGNIQYYEDTDVYYQRSVLEMVKDFNHTAERFGELPLTNREVIVTQRVYRLLQEHKVKDWEVVPIYLVD